MAHTIYIKQHLMIYDMSTKIIYYQHSKLIYNFSLFSGLKSEVLVRHRIFMEQVRQCNVFLLKTRLYLRGYKQFYTFCHIIELQNIEISGYHSNPTVFIVLCNS